MPTVWVRAEAVVAPLIEELCRSSPEFTALWHDNEVQAHDGGVKQLRLPDLGLLSLEYSSFAVDGRPDLQPVVYRPVAEADRLLVVRLMAPVAAMAAE